MLLRLLERSREDNSSFEALVISLGGGNELGKKISDLDVELIQCDLKTFGGYYKLCKAFFRLKVFAPTVVQGWMYHGSFVAFLAAKIMRLDAQLYWAIRQTLYEINNERYLTRLVIKVLAMASSNCDCIVYNSNISFSQHQELGFLATRHIYIPNGIDTKVFNPDETRKKAFRDKLGVLSGQPLIAMVARVHPMKDHETCLKAMALIAEALPHARFVLVGKGTQSNYITGLLEDLGLIGITHRMGLVEKMENIYPGLDLLLLSSNWGEGWPNALGEAMASGVSCVATNVGESKSILEGVGAVVAVNNHYAIAEEAKKILAMSPTERKIIGRKSRDKICRNFEIKNIYNSYSDLWQGKL